MAARTSFRDPSGCCIRLDGRILRLVRRDAAGPLDAILAGPARDWIRDGRLPATRRLEGPEARDWAARLAAEDPALAPAPGDALYEHERIPFASYPAEWPADMLRAAADLTLDLSAGLLPHGLGLKDATPYNVLFRGPEPVMIDVPSIETRAPGDPIWLPYAQFCRTFLLPLLAWRYWRLDPAGLFLAHRDGMEPEVFYRLCGWGRRLRPPVLQHASFPTWFGRRGESGEAAAPPRLQNPEQARFILDRLFASLRGAVAQACPPGRDKTAWTDYMRTHSYSAPGFSAKEGLVNQFLEAARPQAVLDVGANTGHFSLLAARTGSRVVSIDYDAACMGRLWREARAARLDVLPLVVNLARPTPAAGWRNAECASFLERADGSFDLVLMLAVIHHLLVTERVPLPELADLTARLTTGRAVIEYVPPDDPMFQRIVRGREHLHAGLTAEAFETAFAARFRVERKEPVADSGRILYLFEKRTSA